MDEARGKGAGDENFPVASLLIDRRLRPVVLAYYGAARAADDIADDPALSADEKLRRLDRFEAALAGRRGDADMEIAASAGRALTSAGVPLERATQLIRAFRRDAAGGRCARWPELMAYCADSAAPVGRFLLDLHQEDPGDYPAADALCAALQILNHLQDCGEDYRRLDRVYLPGDWLAAEGVAVADLAAPRSSPGLRRVLDRCLAGVDELLDVAGPLPARIRSTRLALETAAILGLAEALARRLKTRDPLAGRIRLSRPAMLWHGGTAALRCLLHRSFRPADARRTTA